LDVAQAVQTSEDCEITVGPNDFSTHYSYYSSFALTGYVIYACVSIDNTMDRYYATNLRGGYEIRRALG
jgi:hypothetical protein